MMAQMPLISRLPSSALTKLASRVIVWPALKVCPSIVNSLTFQLTCK